MKMVKLTRAMVNRADRLLRQEPKPIVTRVNLHNIFGCTQSNRCLCDLVNARQLLVKLKSVEHQSKDEVVRDKNPKRLI
jgi:1,4-dihydroxy-2-naphthoyl-CoA synthase